eukprot:CAMPEP_0119300458 /NCGR_PEP_ID=MMETSP1333-20130426/2400_1 /TAXON_ID=418940 /ORGANISM="Scyphosphaera apsteinii, Strain RCC1455" /LENGTH=496 /DNA_ID=CAMNT_0007302233 /DNA_START=247 /DNA_END=1737 /DNA_ORIENTATION=+
MALAWTHLFLPIFGEADLFQRNAAELMSMHVTWMHAALIWVYTAFVTSACWCLYVLAEKRVDSLICQRVGGTLSEHVAVATWGTLATSLVYVLVWAWICALLSILPTSNPLLAFLSGIVVTIIAATSVVFGQRGCGPFLLLRGSRPDRIKTVVFFTSIMTAMMWVGALDYCVIYSAPSVPRWAAAWCVALLVCGARWLFLWKFRNSRSHFIAAMKSYPSNPDLALSSHIGLVSSTSRADSAASPSPPRESLRESPLRPSRKLPSFSELHTASIGLGALVLAWSGCVALQAASTTTWQDWPFPYVSKAAVAPATAYALAMTAAGVFVVATARTIAEADGMAIHRAEGLAAETSALGVASGWSWYHALECIFPAVCNESPLTRAIGTVSITAFGVMLMLALKPPAGTAYSNESSEHAGEAFSAEAMCKCAPSSSRESIKEDDSTCSSTPPRYQEFFDDCSPTSTRYREFVDLRRNHSADWMPSLQLDMNNEAFVIGQV